MTQPIKAMRRASIAAYFLWVGVGLVAVRHGLAQSPAPAPAPSQTVLVTLTTRYIRISQSALRPGAVRFVIVNQTSRPALTLLVSAAATGSDKLDPTLAIQPSNVRGGQRPSMDVTLTAGVYTLWLSEVPSAASITVTSGGVQ